MKQQVISIPSIGGEGVRNEKLYMIVKALYNEWKCFMLLLQLRNNENTICNNKIHMVLVQSLIS